MKVPLSWLRELCPTDLPPDELAERLTARGVHVEAVLWPWEGLSGVVAARVLEVSDHPNSDKLCVTRVDVGDGTQHQVLAGVRNMEAGDIVPLAPPGSRVPALSEPLSPRELRGLVSEGMLCSPQELALSADHGGILILPPDTPVGADIKRLFGLDDAVIDIEIEPNRPDLMSVFGVAREVSAATGVRLRPPDLSVEEGSKEAGAVATVRIEDLERCPRYLARVIEGVRAGPSPLLAQARLTAAGMRPLSNVVDATNYVLLELGHPLHAFDLALLEGSGIIVRRAAEGERIRTLDDVDRLLTGEDLVIADHAKAVAVAGVMGSAPAEVSSVTRDILLESAYFEPRAVMRAARRLGLATEASMRFERGADPEAPQKAVDRTAALITAWSGGTVLAGTVAAGAAPERRRVRVRPARASLLLGFPVTPQDVHTAFDSLGITATDVGEAVEVEVPGYRVDLEREVDLIEEVARSHGYDRIGSTLPPVRQIGGMMPTYAFRRRVREAFARGGLREAWLLSFASREDAAIGPEGFVRLANPLTADEPFLRRSLLPGLLRAVARNMSRGVDSVALFEVGKVFRMGSNAPEESERVALVMAGSATGWPQAPRTFDFTDAKGAVEAALLALGVRDWTIEAGVDPEEEHLLHPSRAALLRTGDQPLGLVAEVHPRVAAAFDLTTRVAVASLEVPVLMAHAEALPAFRDPPRFPPVRRDLAFLVDADTPAGEVRRAILAAAGDMAASAELFDVFTGGPVPAGRKSLAFAVTFRAEDRTLTDHDAETGVEAIRAALTTAFGAELRTG